MKPVRYIQTLGSFRLYYRSINEILAKAFGRLHMLHYPLYVTDAESLERRQQNLIDHCLHYLGDLKGKDLLEVGCGNGLNCHYIDRNRETGSITGIDLNPANLELARSVDAQSSVVFVHDNAQELATVPDGSVDVLICIESAFHYPDKFAFFRQIKRVLRPEGTFLIVDIILAPEDEGRSLWFWKKNKMLYHAKETDYQAYSSGNQLKFQSVENLTERVIRGYEGHRAWVDSARMNWMDFTLMRFFNRLQVRLNVAELQSHKQYMLFHGRHA
ncbi:MAG: class I SAM-dependent methyltransferase [Bacteroidales bacterium]